MNLCIPEKVLQQHAVWLGKTGAGKSSSLRHVVEWLLWKKKRVCAVDPKGDWWGLKIAADGKSPSFCGDQLVAFGNFKEAKATDIPLNAKSGKQVAELITSGNRPCIIGMRGWMPTDMREFWIDFASTLFNSNTGELYVVLDECHNFAPKGKILDPKSGEMIHWTNRLLSEGRGLGLTFLIASQRPQKVHNDTLTCCETLVAMRVTHEADRDALEGWIEGCGDSAQAKALLGNVARLARGSAYVWSPEIGFGPEVVDFPMFTTFDSFAPPQVQKKVSQSGWSTVDLEAVKEKFAQVIEEAKDNDPVELKKKIRDLEKKIAEGPAAAVDENAIQSAVENSLAKRDKAWQGAIDRHLQNVNGFVTDVCRRLSDNIRDMTSVTTDFLKQGWPKFEAPINSVADSARDEARLQTILRPDISKQVVLEHSRSRAAVEVNGDLDGPQQKIVNAIAWLNAVGVEHPKQAAVAFLAGYTVDGGGFKNPRSNLRVKGLVQYVGDRIVLTEEGRRLAAPPQTSLTPRQLHEQVFSVLPGPEQKILRTVIDAYPGSITDKESGRLSGYNHTGGGFKNPRSRLRTLGLIDYPEKGKLRAADFLFLKR